MWLTVLSQRGMAARSYVVTVMSGGCLLEAILEMSSLYFSYFFWCECFFGSFCFPEMLNIYKSQHFLNQGHELSTLMCSAWPHEVALMLSMPRCGEVTPGVWALLAHHITTHYLGCGSPDPGTITNTISGLFVHFQEARRCHHHSAEEHLTHTAVVTSP